MRDDRDKENIKCRHEGIMWNIYRVTFIISRNTFWRVDFLARTIQHMWRPRYKLHYKSEIVKFFYTLKWQSFVNTIVNLYSITDTETKINVILDINAINMSTKRNTYRVGYIKKEFLYNIVNSSSQFTTLERKK